MNFSLPVTLLLIIFIVAVAWYVSSYIGLSYNVKRIRQILESLDEVEK